MATKPRKTVRVVVDATDNSPPVSATPSRRTVLSDLVTGNQSNGNGSSTNDLPSPPHALGAASAPSAFLTPPVGPTPINTALALSPTSPSLKSLWLQAKSEAAHGRAYWTEEQYVEDITVSFLYQPHTIIALTTVVLLMVYYAFIHNDQRSITESLQVGCRVVAFFVIVLGLIVFPSGPFVRPHPLLWRLVFGVAVLYEIVLILLLYLSKAQAREALTFFYPYLNQPLVERPYAEDCAFTFDNLWAGFADQYAASHFIGWVVKSLIIRDNLLCWIISIQWELLEISFTHLLPNFAECWWDQWLLDVLICNGLGIYVGHLLCEYLEMKEYNWRGFNQIHTLSGKLHRAMMQFTPQSWVKVRWEKTKNLKMFFFLQFLVFAFHWEEMNAFFLKHLLWVPPPCPLNLIRLLIWAFVGVPSLRQVYQFMTDPLCKRIGTQTFLAVLILVTETILIVKLSPGEFTNKSMKPNVVVLVTVCLVAWVLWNGWMVRRIYKQEKRTFFAEGEKLAKIREESPEPLTSGADDSNGHHDSKKRS